MKDPYRVNVRRKRIAGAKFCALHSLYNLQETHTVNYLCLFLRPADVPAAANGKRSLAAAKRDFENVPVKVPAGRNDTTEIFINRFHWTPRTHLFTSAPQVQRRKERETGRRERVTAAAAGNAFAAAARRSARAAETAFQTTPTTRTGCIGIWKLIRIFGVEFDNV